MLLIGVSDVIYATDNANVYDIPLHELNKVKKKSQKVSNKKKVNFEKKQKELPSEAAVANEAVAKTPSSSVMKEIQINKETTQHAVKTVSEVAKAPTLPMGNVKIHHTPFSFVIPAKRTVINAVISSNNEVKEVNCIFRTFEDSFQTLKMEKVSGSFFTYSATLPVAPAVGYSLRYSIIAVDNFGNVFNSNEYSTPVESYPITPSWQIEDVIETKQLSPNNETKLIKDYAVPLKPAEK
jgi:hypothetical protein